MGTDEPPPNGGAVSFVWRMGGRTGGKRLHFSTGMIDKAKVCCVFLEGFI